MKRCFLLCLLVAACTGEQSAAMQSSDAGGQTSSGGDAQTPTDTIEDADASVDASTGFPLSELNVVYSGTYIVPTVAPSLAAAATFAVSEVHWTVSATGAVHLDYDLPAGLVGTPIHVEFDGAVAPGTSEARLTGLPGTATCTIAGTQLSCLENMQGLKPLNTDMAAVAAAATDYAGAVQDRIDVATQFQGDPIGIIRFDGSAGVIDDKGGKAKGKAAPDP